MCVYEFVGPCMYLWTCVDEAPPGRDLFPLNRQVQRQLSPLPHQTTFRVGSEKIRIYANRGALCCCIGECGKIPSDTGRQTDVRTNWRAFVLSLYVNIRAGR